MIKANELRPKTEWQRIFLQSRVNGASYEEQEWNVKWPWPEDMFLRRRLNYLRSGGRDPRELISERLEHLAPGIIGCSSGSNAIGSWQTSRYSLIVELPSDDWTWCANPTDRRRFREVFKAACPMLLAILAEMYQFKPHNIEPYLLSR